MVIADLGGRNSTSGGSRFNVPKVRGKCAHNAHPRARISGRRLGRNPKIHRKSTVCEVPVGKTGLSFFIFVGSLSGRFRLWVPATLPGGPQVWQCTPPLPGAVCVSVGRTPTLMMKFIVCKSSDTPRGRHKSDQKVSNNATTLKNTSPQRQKTSPATVFVQAPPKKTSSAAVFVQAWVSRCARWWWTCVLPSVRAFGPASGWTRVK